MRDSRVVWGSHLAPDIFRLLRAQLPTGGAHDFAERRRIVWRAAGARQEQWKR